MRTCSLAQSFAMPVGRMPARRSYSGAFISSPQGSTAGSIRVLPCRLDRVEQPAGCLLRLDIKRQSKSLASIGASSTCSWLVLYPTI